MRRGDAGRRLVAVAGALALSACAGSAIAGAGVAPAPTTAAGIPGGGDTTSTSLVPAGFGTLRQDDVALQLTLVGGVAVRAIPLDESVIRLLSPDSYRTLHEYKQGRSAQLAQIARRYGYDRYSVWLVSFTGTEQGEARFSPRELLVRNAGRDFRPLDLVPLTPGFGEQRLRQRVTQYALFVFDGTLDVNQTDLAVSMEGARDDSWGAPDGPLARIERERALVRSRAARGAAPAAPAGTPRPPAQKV